MKSLDVKRLTMTFICFFPSRYDLRVRYIPLDFMEKFKEDRTTMLYLYLQVSRAQVAYQQGWTGHTGIPGTVPVGRCLVGAAQHMHIRMVVKCPLSYLRVKKSKAGC